MGEQQYLCLLRECLEQGSLRQRRNGMAYGLFGRQMRFDLSAGFPLLTTKRVHFKSVAAELLWFLRGDTNTAYLHQYGVTIWDEWADENGDLGPIYGKQWRDFGGVDQIVAVLESLRHDPHSSRHVVSPWNPPELPEMALPPCHGPLQFYVSDGRLSCGLYQRSADVFLGVPYNIASYALLTHLIARETGLEAGELVHSLGDVHLYADHFEQARQQLSREPRPLPFFHFDSFVPELDALAPDDLTQCLYEYYPHPAITAPVSA